MPRYNYICNDCLTNAAREVGRELADAELGALIFEVIYTFTATDAQKKAVSQCPTCEGYNTKITIFEAPAYRVRGHNWEEFRRENKGAMQRDMALHQLHDEDPYGYMRKPGEVSDLADKIRSGARKQSQAKVFDCGAKSRSKKAK